MARIVQGAGAALLVPNSLALIQQAFPDQAVRSRAVGWWGAAGGMALAAGPVAGGFLVAHFGWRSIFLINLPIGLIGLAMTLRHARPSPANPHRSLDLPGQGAAVMALAALAIALIEAGRLGWTDPWIVMRAVDRRDRRRGLRRDRGADGRADAAAGAVPIPGIA